MPRPTGRGHALLALAVATYLAARLVGTWELYLLAFAFLAMLVLSWVIVLATGRRIRVTRTIDPDRPVAGDEPELVFHVANLSWLPGPQVTIRSRLGDLASERLDLEVESLSPRGKRVLRARVPRVNRGVHLVPAADVAAEDPLGLARSIHKASDPITVTVFPRIAPLESCALQPGIGLRQDWSGRRGLPTLSASEFRGVRPHQPGEPLSHIDWKSTAKTGMLMLREMEEPAGSDVTLLLDGTAGEVVGEAPSSNFEVAVQAAGSIADFVLRAGRGVSLIRHERRWRQERLTADGAGRRALMQALAETRPDASAPLASALRRLRTDGARLLRAESVTIVSLSLETQLARALLELREAGARVAFLYVAGASFAGPAPQALSYLLPFLPPREGNAHTAPASALSAEARSLLLSLSGAGIPCQTLDRGDDLVRRLSLWDPAHRDFAAAR
jgi:uncharacterized protein (DUF58 family)